MLKNYTFLGTTQSLCPECLQVVPAKIITRGSRVYFRKKCPTHGEREDFVCSDVKYYDRLEYSVPGRQPRAVGVEPDKGCPLDCGLCTEHEQHSCVGLIEITSNCNLTCPMCYASSAPGGKHLTFEQVVAAIDRLVEVEGEPEILQLSGGEPTLHPEFMRIVEYAYSLPIDMIMINTNGVRFANDDALLKALHPYRDRLEVYLQFDGFRDETYIELRGEPLAKIKQRAISKLGEHELRITLVTTLQNDVNEDEIGAIIQFGVERPWISGVSLQPATYSGRFMEQETLENRITFPDVIKAIRKQTEGLFQESDFTPLPCAHPNCHSLAFAYRHEGGATPINRFIDMEANFDLLANGIMITKPRAKRLVEQLLNRLGQCVGDDCCGGEQAEADAVELHSFSADLNAIDQANGNGEATPLLELAKTFFDGAIEEQIKASDVFRVIITSFLDPYNFDIRRLMKCCIHHVLPSGHLIPFCAYNVLYRDGHVPLPELQTVVDVTNDGPAKLSIDPQR